MRKIKILFATALVCLAMPMSAQFLNSPSSSSVTSSANNPVSYNSFTVGYNSNTFSLKDDDESMDGFAIQLLTGMKISNTMPLYIEAGGRLTMGFLKEETNAYYDIEHSVIKLSVSVPINLTYRFNVGGNALIAPYAGLHLTGNILGIEKYGKKTYNKFDKYDIGKDGQWTRFQYGLQFGSNLSFGCFNIGLEYSLDLNEISKKVSTSDFIVSVGFNF